MNSIILTYPNVTLIKAVNSKSGTGFDELKEVVNKEYGYNLTVGQKLYCIRYKGSNAEMYVCPIIVEIQEKGLVITALNIRDKVTDEKGNTTFINTTKFIPFKKSLPSAGVYEDREMCIEPCGELFFTDKKLKHILQLDPLWDEIWYMHGGWSTKCGSWDNLHKFIKMGQLELGVRTND